MPDTKLEIHYKTVSEINPATRADLSIPDFVEIYDLWDELRGEKFAPPWSKIELIKFPLRRIPQCVVVDVIPDPLDFVYRFWGTKITNLHRQDLTGKSVRLLNPPEAGETLYQQYARALALRSPAIFVNQLTSSGGGVTEEVILRLPLSSDGDQINHFICAFDFGEDPSAYRKYLEIIKEAS